MPCIQRSTGDVGLCAECPKRRPRDEVEGLPMAVEEMDLSFSAKQYLSRVDPHFGFSACGVYDSTGFQSNVPETCSCTMML
jgi:hypothetical protein